MCLIMTILAAVVSGGTWLILNKNGKATKSLLTTTLMFLAAALMWCVDGIASVAAGEGFFDISAADTILGLIILAFGAAVFAVLTFIEKKQALAKA